MRASSRRHGRHHGLHRAAAASRAQCDKPGVGQLCIESCVAQPCHFSVARSFGVRGVRAFDDAGGAARLHTITYDQVMAAHAIPYRP